MKPNGVNLWRQGKQGGLLKLPFKAALIIIDIVTLSLIWRENLFISSYLTTLKTLARWNKNQLGFRSYYLCAITFQSMFLDIVWWDDRKYI